MSRNGININASLLREVRMIAQRLIGGTQPNYYAMHIAEAHANQSAPALKCAPCLQNLSKRPQKRKNAVTIYAGTAVCEEHLGLAAH